MSDTTNTTAPDTPVQNPGELDTGILEDILRTGAGTGDVQQHVADWFAAKVQTQKIKNYHLANTSYLAKQHEAQTLGLNEAAKHISPFKEVTVIQTPQSQQAQTGPRQGAKQPSMWQTAALIGAAALAGGGGVTAAQWALNAGKAVKPVIETIDNTEMGDVGLKLE